MTFLAYYLDCWDNLSTTSKEDLLVVRKKPMNVTKLRKGMNVWRGIPLTADGTSESNSHVLKEAASLLEFSCIHSCYFLYCIFLLPVKLWLR